MVGPQRMPVAAGARVKGFYVARGTMKRKQFNPKNVETLLTLADGYELTVIAELTDWYQVSDPETGKVGFVYYTYVEKSDG